MNVTESAGLIWVRHEGKGTGAEARLICSRIRSLSNSSAGRYFLVHDARELAAVDDEFVKVFMQFEKERGTTFCATLCVIPNVWLRTLAKAVGSLSPGKWRFFSSIAEVERYLAAHAQDGGELGSGV